MSQDFTDDCFDPDHDALATDMPNIENNFAALKSSFSGTSAPPDTVAGMWWFDTTNNIMKLRNEANDAWMSIFDFDTLAPAGLTATLAEINAVCDGCLSSAAEINDACNGVTARNSHVHSNITVTAGTNMTGGGALSADITLNAMVAGIVAVDDPTATRTITGDIYAAVASLYVDVDDVDKLRLIARLKSSFSGATASIRFTIGALTATAATTTSTSYTTVRTASLDVSSLSGLQTITVEMKNQVPTYTSSAQRIAVYVG